MPGRVYDLAMKVQEFPYWLQLLVMCAVTLGLMLLVAVCWDWVT